MIENDICEVTMNHNKITPGQIMYSKNGETVTVQQVFDETIIVKYQDKEFERSIDLIGKTLFAAECYRFKYTEDLNSPGGFISSLEGEISYDHLVEVAETEHLLDKISLHCGHGCRSYSVLIEQIHDAKWLVRKSYDQGPVGGYITDCEGNAYACALVYLRELNEQLARG